MNALEIKDLHKIFGKSEMALNNASLTLPKGAIGALVGPSGSGKTTLLRSIAGLEQPGAGSIFISEKAVFDSNTNISPSERNIGFLFQDYALFPHLTVAENVAFGLRNLSGDLKTNRTNQYMNLCNIEQYAKRFPHELSGGQQQRVALARALAMEPELLLLDEPFSNVDDSLKSQIREEMASLIRLCKTSALIVVHDIQDAFAISDQISVLIDGEVLQTDSSDNIYQKPVSEKVGRVSGEICSLNATVKGGEMVTAIGTIPFNQRAEKSEWKILLRPEELTLTTGADWGVNRCRFNGMGYIIRCEKGLEIVKVLSPTPLNEGIKTSIAFASQNLRLV